MNTDVKYSVLTEQFTKTTSSGLDVAISHVNFSFECVGI